MITTKKFITGFMIIFGLVAMVSATAYADKDKHKNRNKKKQSTHYVPHVQSKNYRFDKRFKHDRYYPRRGHSVKVLPHRHVIIRYHNTHYYYYGGIWYRPSGTRFIVVAPPVGVVVPVLPPFYTTIWFNSVPYYYANDVYYVWRPDLDGYVVAEPPEEISEEMQPVMSDELYIYPKKGQSEEKQADDRFACHQWSVKQTNYDPTKPSENMSVSALNKTRENYQRAMRSCLEGRGYSVR